MCGIVGYVGARDAAPLILEGLRRLEYRGYDSAGLAVVTAGGRAAAASRDGEATAPPPAHQLVVRRDVGKLSNLERLLADQPVHGQIGIGHTRWATHGAPSARNAHPHVGMTGDVVVVHNGIVENYQDLRAELAAEGSVFNSETDTEVIAHLVERYLSGGIGLPEAVRLTLAHLQGAHGLVVLSSREPDKLVAARIGNAGGVTLGLGQGEMFVASDIPAILEHTRQMVFLESRQMAVVTRNGYQVQTLAGEPIVPDVHSIAWDPVAAEKGEYKHFMLKEIYEQARAVTDTIRGRADFEAGRVRLPELNLTAGLANRLQKLVIVACGTSAYSGQVGRALVERLARLPVEVDIASEFRYRDPLVGPDTAVLALTQSGETVDTLAAMEEARQKGAVLWSIVNAVGSQAMRVADGTITMQAGPEIGVASTKAFTTSIVDQYLLACLLGELRGTLTGAALRQAVDDLARLPDLVGRALERGAEIEPLARELMHTRHFLYLGRGPNVPIAYEGALKLKEISYIHAEGYAGGEMKHGPIALIDREMPVLAIATRGVIYDKMLSQVEQAKARGGLVVALATEGDTLIASRADRVLWVPAAPELLQPVVNVVPLQLLAYHIAVLRGCDVDQPRNLAKSVTVE
ncbi:MAG: glutamine--fructose-6-phosphate transaminase (isomerizing) [Anaerolineales bacterium]|nr:glutamine--fructose-6-phosphate transaminase (isomerizing) [Anaerolineales bacterium]